VREGELTGAPQKQAVTDGAIGSSARKAFSTTAAATASSPQMRRASANAPHPIRA